MDHDGERHWSHHDYARSDMMKDQFIPLKSVLNAVNPREDDIIVDAACGSGHYSLEFASRSRRVIAIDSGSDAIKIINEKIGRQAIKNIVPLRENLCKFVPDAGNKVFIANAFHDISCKEDFVRMYASKLNFPVFILIEFKKGPPIGPPDSIRIGEQELENIFKRAGYSLEYRDLLEVHYIHRYSKSKSA